MGEQNKISAIPSFTGDEGGEEIQGQVISSPEEVKEEVEEEVQEEQPIQTNEKETQANPPVAKEPGSEGTTDDTQIPREILDREIARATEGMRAEITKLRKELSTAIGSKRNLIENKIADVEQKIEDLSDVNPDDITLIEKVLKAKGYVRKDEVEANLYDRVKQEELDKFLEEFPEYKPENDPGDVNWNLLQREIQLYRQPADPRQIGDILRRSHKSLRVPSGRDATKINERKVQTASVGGGGGNSIQRPSSKKSFAPHIRQHMIDGGWSEEEIRKAEERLPE